MNTANTVLAIDPGTDRSAYVLWDGKRIRGKGIVENQHMLDMVREGDYDQMAVERIASYGMPVGEEVFTTCLWVGRYMEAADANMIPYRLIYRREIKLHLCGDSRAKDAHIRQRLIDLLGAPGTKKKPGVTYGMAADMWAALAIAITWMEKYGG